MNRKFFIIMISLCLLNVVEHVFSQSELPNSVLDEKNPKFYKYDQHTYAKKELSNCETNFQVKEGTLRLSWGGEDCQSNTMSNIESTKEIAHSLKEIVKQFNLVGKLSEFEFFFIQTAWKISHWHLVDSINNDVSWPVNIEKTLYSNEANKQGYKRYVEFLRKKIVSEDVYGPIMKAMSELGCDMRLAKNFGDPIYDIVKVHTSKQELLRTHVYQESQIRKSIYPFFKGWISFDLNCQQ